MAPRPSPTARRRRLAAALRQMREERQWSCADAGKAAGWSESKISRIETGRVGVRQPDLERLLDLYELTARPGPRCSPWAARPPTAAGGTPTRTHYRPTSRTTSAWRTAPSRCPPTRTSSCTA